MTSAMCSLRPRWRRIDHRIQTFPTVHRRIHGASTRYQPDSFPPPGAVYQRVVWAYCEFQHRRSTSGAPSPRNARGTLPSLDTLGGPRGLQVPFGQSEPQDRLKRPVSAVAGAGAFMRG